MATLDEVKAAAKQMDAAKDALLNYLEKPHKHDDPKRDQLIAAVKQTAAKYLLRVIEEPPDETSS